MKKRLPLQVAVYALTLPDAEGGQRLLLLRREPQRNGFWQGITGGVEEGETLKQAAEREFLEETGCSIHLNSLPVWSYTFELAPGFWHLYTDAKTITETVYHIILSRFKPQLSDEHDAWGWVDPTAALAIVRWPQNRTSIQRILQQTSGYQTVSQT